MRSASDMIGLDNYFELSARGDLIQPTLGDGISDQNLKDFHKACQSIQTSRRCQKVLPGQHPLKSACLKVPMGHGADVKWSYRVATIAGIQVRIHLTFLLLLAFYAWIYYKHGGPQAGIEGVVFTLLIFLCVLLHEFGHALAARTFGIRTPDITLLPIGGVARLERMPANPQQEFVIAIAGPAVNVLIAIAIFVVIGGVVPLRGVWPGGYRQWDSARPSSLWLTSCSSSST